MFCLSKVFNIRLRTVDKRADFPLEATFALQELSHFSMPVVLLQLLPNHIGEPFGEKNKLLISFWKYLRKYVD